MAAALSVSLASCSGSEAEDKPQAAATTAAEEGYPYDTSNVGEDLLAAERTSHTFRFGGDSPILWRFPASYAAGKADETASSIETGGVQYEIRVVTGIGTSPREQAEESAKGRGAAIHEVRLGGRDWLAVVDDGEELSILTLFGSFPGGVVNGALLSASAPLADVPPERIDELHQMAQSIEVKAG
ncbi:hypothetical protein GEV29_09885 [Aeromicrobium sp. SMF47]|uniref:hypothetical protein n=1 Tax=Aeromicrobium yanjiei TaxID=2662028 RepID=UPI00129EE23A|nr:hypothetical protein [Aeromicrobium yanjiei]MRJ76846.1 hypothetical protein [Aeromicrobium yanjiei]